MTMTNGYPNDQPQAPFSADRKNGAARRFERPLLISVLVLQAALLLLWLLDYQAKRELLASLREGSRVNAAFINGVAAALGQPPANNPNDGTFHTFARSGPIPFGTVIPRDGTLPDLVFPAKMMEYHWRMQGQMDQMLRSVLGDIQNLESMITADSPWPADTAPTVVDMRESAEGYLITLQAPYLHATDVSLSLDGRLLTIATTRQAGNPAPGGNRIQRVWLPGSVARDSRPLAEITNHALRIMVPKHTAMEVAVAGGASR